MSDPKIIPYLNKNGARWGQVDGIDCVLDYGENSPEYALQSEVLALKANGIAYRGERSTIAAQGDDLIPLMQGLVTGDVFQLSEPGRGMRTAAVDINGKMVFDVRLLHIEDMLLIDLEPGVVAAGLLSHFTKNIINEDVVFVDKSDGLSKIAFFGKYGFERVCSTCTRVNANIMLGKFDATIGHFEGSDIIIQRIDFGTIPAYEVTLKKEHTVPFLDAALGKGSVLVGEKAQEIHRFREHVPRFALDRRSRIYGAELSSDIIPLEAELNDWVSFTKGCYLGQEIIARLDSKGTPAKLLRRLESNSSFPVGSPLFIGEKTVGEIVVSISEDDHFYEYAAFIKRNTNEIGGDIYFDKKNSVHTIIRSYN